MFSVILSFSLLSLHPQEKQVTAAQAWQYEQSQRKAASEVLGDNHASKEAIRKVLGDLDKLIDYCLKPEIKALKNGEGTPILYYQVNDILVQQVEGYARLGDRDTAAAKLEALKVNLAAPDTWIKDDSIGFFTFYANQIRWNKYVLKLLPDSLIEASIMDIRNHDPYGTVSAVPYTTQQADLTPDDRIAGLSMIWSEARYNFVNFRNVPHLDWNDAYQKYLPKVRNARNSYDYYNLLREFIGLLKDSHTDIALPGWMAQKNETKPGITTELIDGRVVIWRDQTEAVQKLGLRRGDVIQSIDGVDAVEYGRKTWAYRISCSTPQDEAIRTYAYYLLRGPMDRPAKLEVEHADGKVETITVPRNEKLPSPDLPSAEFKVLPDGTAYLAFNTCGDSIPSEMFAKHLDDIRKAGRLIIDCRLNDGGSTEIGYSILGHLIDHPIKTCQWETRTYRPSYRAWERLSDPTGDIESVDPDKDRFAGPVAVLCGPRTFSAGEDFISAYKMCKRGLLIGMPSGGSTGQPLLIPLPGGGRARICTKHDRMADGTEFVGVGVQPDIKVWTTLAAIRKGTDPVLEEALRQVNK